MTDMNRIVRRFGTDNVLPPSVLKLLFVILQMYNAGEHLTARSLMKRTKARSTNYIAIMLKRLKAAGLIRWDGSAAISPTCYLRIYPEELKS